MDFVDDPVVTDPDPICVLYAGQLRAARRSRCLTQQIDSGSDSLLLRPRQFGDGLDGAAGDLDPVLLGHARPRSALTSSQGT